MDTAFMPELYKSQWSLTFEVRKRDVCFHPRRVEGLVAMEPDL